MINLSHAPPSTTSQAEVPSRSIVWHGAHETLWLAKFQSIHKIDTPASDKGLATIPRQRVGLLLRASRRRSSSSNSNSIIKAQPASFIIRPPTGWLANWPPLPSCPPAAGGRPLPSFAPRPQARGGPARPERWNAAVCNLSARSSIRSACCFRLVGTPFMTHRQR